MAHKNLHDWLRDHPDNYLATQYHTNGQISLAILCMTAQEFFATGDNYEEACYNLLQKLPR